MSSSPRPPAVAVPQRAAVRPRLLLLIADPDPDGIRAVQQQLGDHHIDVVVAADPAEAMLRAGMLLPDAVLCAARMPPMSGSALIRALQAHTDATTVVGIGTDDGDEASAALTAGAVACVARPYRLGELLPILRSIRPDTMTSTFGPPLEIGALRIDPATMEVNVHGQRKRLPLREFALLHLLMLHAGRIVTRQQIVQLLWNGEETSNTVNVHIRRIRQHLGDDPQNPTVLLTVRGMGYRLVPPDRRATTGRPRSQQSTGS